MRKTARNRCPSLFVSSLWLFEFEAALDGLPVSQVNQETLELAEAIGNLFVKNRVLELRAAMDVIPIEAAYSGHDCVDRALTQVAFIPPGSIS